MTHAAGLASLRPVSLNLAQGPRALLVPLPKVQRAVITAFLRTGSRFEAPAESGLSHFLEHMLFRGTPRWPGSHALSTAFEELGGTLQASTAADHGTLGISVPAVNFAAAAEAFVEVLRSPLLLELELERGIIREEILEDLNDQGELVDSSSLLRALAFPEHGLGQPITGTLSTLESLTREQLSRHHALTYHPDNLVLVVSGRVTPDEAERALAGAFPAGSPGQRLAAIPPPPQTGPRFRYAHQEGSSQTRLHLGFRCPGEHSPEEASTELLLRILDDGMSTRVYHRLCDQSGLCYDASASFETWDEVGLVEIVADTSHDRAPRVLEEALALTADLSAHGPTEAEFERARRRLIWQFESLLDEPDSVADYVAGSALRGLSPHLDERLEQLLSVTREEVRNAAARIFVPEGRNVVAVSARRALLRKLLPLAEGP